MSSITYGTDASDPTPIAQALKAAELRFRPPIELRRTRIDTFDGRLHATGLRLELRSRPGVPGSSELVLSGGGGAPAHLPLPADPDPTTALASSTLPPGPFRDRLVRTSGGRALLPRLTVTSTRQTGEHRASAGAPRLRVHLDTAARIDGHPPTPRSTIEVEELPGGEKPARRLRRQLEHEGLVPFPGDALERAVRIAGIDPGGWQGLTVPPLDRGAPALEGFRSVLRSCADALDANWQGTIDDLDDEFLHDLRIAVRRIRSVLTEGRQVLPPQLRRDQRTAFAWLGGLTGPARDLDVYVDGWAELTSPLTDAERRVLEPVLAHLRHQRTVEHQRVSDGLGSPRGQGTRTRLRGWLEVPDLEVAGGPRAGDPLGRIVAKRIHAAQHGVLTDGRAIGPESPAADLHQLRKDAKRLRYLLESFGVLGGRRRSRQIIGHLKQLQDNLGEHQDTQVQADRLRQAVAELARQGNVAAETTAAVEELAIALEARQAAARVQFADRFAAYDRKEPRRALAELLARMAR
jgi:CHAD domain-containing protein